MASVGIRCAFWAYSAFSDGSHFALLVDAATVVLCLPIASWIASPAARGDGHGQDDRSARLCRALTSRLVS
jgi:hypothetical protein